MIVYILVYNITQENNYIVLIPSSESRGDNR